MNASKENAAKALKDLIDLSDAMNSRARLDSSARLIRLQEFLEAAQRRLPREASIEKDRQRRRTAKS
jgi:hypothetical protein